MRLCRPSAGSLCEGAGLLQALLRCELLNSQGGGVQWDMRIGELVVAVVALKLVAPCLPIGDGGGAI